MTSKQNIKNSIPSNQENPFKVPEGYFEGLHDKLMDKISSIDETKEGVELTPEPIHPKIYLRPYLAFAASISGLALIVYIIVQSVLGSGLNESDSYDLAILDQAGITLDEYALAETWSESEDNEYTEWEEGAMNYLASNEVDLFQLLESN